MSDHCFLIIVFGSVLFLSLLALILVLKYSKEHFTDTDPMIIELHAILSKIHPHAANNVNIQRGNKSFTVNKKDITLCLKDQEGEYYNKNMLVYVAIHELAHTLCKSVGHTDEFYKINDKLLNKASQLGVYNPSIPVVKDYIEHCR